MVRDAMCITDSVDISSTERHGGIKDKNSVLASAKSMNGHKASISQDFTQRTICSRADSSLVSYDY